MNKLTKRLNDNLNFCKMSTNSLSCGDRALNDKSPSP